MLRHSRHSIIRFCQFTLASLSAASTCLLGYAMIVDRQIPQSNMPATYKAFLLRDVPGPRLIIDSGSNSHHALDAATMSQTLGITAINIADNAGYDLEAKIARLAALSQKGDAILLPLEWSYYTRERLTDDFVSTLFGSAKDYYQALSWAKRIKLALSIPPKDTLSHFMRAPEPPALPTDMTTAQQLYISALQAPHGSFAYDQARALQPGVGGQTCDAYIFGPDIQNVKPQISDKFKRALKQLGALQKMGIKVMFTWPVVAGDGCLTSSPHIYAFQSSVDAMVKDAGFPVLGTISNSQYPVLMRDDTPYHLITEGREQHTARVIDYLKSSTSLPSSQSLDLQSFATKRIDELERANLEHRKMSALTPEQEVMLGATDAAQSVDFAAGWWAQDAYGYLMRAHRAVIGLQLPLDTPLDAQIVLKGTAIGAAAYRMQATYNGALLAQSAFSQEQSFAIPTEKLPRGKPFWLHLDLPDTPPSKSPKQRGENIDERSMTLRLSTLLLTQDKLRNPSAENPSDLEPIPSPILDEQDSTPIASITPEVSPLEQASIEGILPLPKDQQIMIDDESISRYLEFDDGWWPQEIAGRWMKKRSATLSLILPGLDNANTVLSFYGDVFDGPSQPIEIFYEGRSIMRGVLQNGAPVRLPLDQLPVNQKIQLQLVLPQAPELSPFDRALSNDTRILTGFLSALAIEF